MRPRSFSALLFFLYHLRQKLSVLLAHIHGWINEIISYASDWILGKRQPFKAGLIVVQPVRIRGLADGEIESAKALKEKSSITTRQAVAREELTHGFMIGVIVFARVFE